ncbi:MAG: FBP domain-containing protein, partial [Bdellovibrionaceae bacterium]|nr:FBP domain-containing protein [Pseudobdellovibrionaceae bacterium]
MLTTLNNFQTENIFSISSEEELVQSFRARDQKKLVLPAGLKYPMNVRSYLTWKESSGVYTYLVFKKPEWDLPKGVAFKRLNAGGEQPAGGMCNWCHAYGSSEEIGML